MVAPLLINVAMSNYKTTYFRTRRFRSSYGYIARIINHSPRNTLKGQRNEMVSKPLGGDKIAEYFLGRLDGPVEIEGSKSSTSNEIFLFKRIKYQTLMKNRKENSSENYGI